MRNASVKAAMAGLASGLVPALAWAQPSPATAQRPREVMSDRPPAPVGAGLGAPASQPRGPALTPREMGSPRGPAGYCGGVRVVVVEPREEPEPPTDSGVNIQLQFDAGVPLSHRQIFEFVAAEWESVLLTNGLIAASYPIRIEYKDLAGTKLGLATVSFERGTNRLISAVIEIDNVTNWFVDATPGDSSEFAGGVGPPGTDLLSVVRHEMGHCFGWLGNDFTYLRSFMTGLTFDPSRTNIALASDSDIGHADPEAHPGELMQPSIAPGVRRVIALYPTVALTARAYNVRIPAQFVDPAFGGTQDGRAVAPWRTASAADNGASPFLPLFLAPTTHRVPTNTLLDRAGEILPVRGGAIISSP